MIHYFKETSHPEANGKTPKENDMGFTLDFPVENRQKLFIDFGIEGLITLRNVVNLCVDDFMRENPEEYERIITELKAVQIKDFN